MALALRRGSRTKRSVSFLVGWALILGVAPFLEIAVTRATLGGFDHMPLTQAAASVWKGPWTLVTLFMRM